MRDHWPVLIPLVLGFVVRVWDLGMHSLLLDEAFVAVGARDIAFNHTPMWDAISNAPFVWCISRLLVLFGDGSGVLRAGSVILGSASILVVYALGSRLFDRRTALIATFIFALHPFAVAFSRVLFADPYQVFFILCGILIADRLCRASSGPSRYFEGFVFVIVWAIAFLAKYNAIVPGLLWVASGWISGRYVWRHAILAMLGIVLASLITLLIWPIDATVWLAAFLEKGGSYNIYAASHYFGNKLGLVFGGETDLVLFLGLIVALLSGSKIRMSFAHLILFVLIYITAATFLGRTFERYLLVLIGPACILIAGLVSELRSRALRTRAGILRLGSLIALLVIVSLYLNGTVRSAKAYLEYLHNDVDMQVPTSHVVSLERQGRRGFWLLPEPVVAYYLGFSRHYSRALPHRPDTGLTAINYTNFSTLSYEADRENYGVLEARGLLHFIGLTRILLHPAATWRRLQALRDSIRTSARPPVVDYLNGNFVRSGDVLVMEGGVHDVQAEPVLERIEGGLPPTFGRLPLESYTVDRVYRPHEVSSISDTTIDPIRAGIWILIHK